jgi:HD-GYP domain-containing protein (c-di-GMP phosphodiesterase class II)
MNTYTEEVLEQVEQLLNVGIALSTEKDHNRLLEMIVSEARRITRADGGTLYLKDGDCLRFKIMQNQTMNVFQGGAGEPINLPPVPLQKSNVSSYVALTRQSVNIADVYASEEFDFTGPKNYDRLTGYHTVSMLVVPLENHENEVIGVLQLINRLNTTGEAVAFPAYFEKVVSSLASQAAIALTKINLMRDIENLFKSFVEVMATAIDARTPYNANHTRRVALLSGMLALAVNDTHEGTWASEYFDEDRLNQLVMAGWLHDIGKIATPLTVMNKATRLEGKIEIVLQRFAYIKECIKAAGLEAKLKDGKTCPSEQYWQEQLHLIDQARELIIKVDNPSTFVNEEIAGRLQELATRTYHDESGNEHPWLTTDELDALCVVKGTLTEQERKIMEDHVLVTKRMLEKIPFTKKLKDVPYFASIHHEHLDGKGYPAGLKGDEIPLEGRILALVDVFDALTAADRPYKKALPLEQALKILGFMVKDGELDRDLYDIFCHARVWEGMEDCT